MAMQLDTEAESVIREKVASGRYPDAATVIREALAALEERERLHRLRALVADGFASAERGALTELTPEHMEEPTRPADESERLGRQPNPDVCP